MDIRIDTATGGGPDDYEVTFQVTELGRARGTINTMVGNQEGSLLTGLAAPNLLGKELRTSIAIHCTYNLIYIVRRMRLRTDIYQRLSRQC